MITYMQLGDALSDELMREKEITEWRQLNPEEREYFYAHLEFTAKALKRNGFLIDEENQVKLN